MGRVGEQNSVQTAPPECRYDARIKYHAVAVGQHHVLETTCCTGYGEEGTRHHFTDEKDEQDRSAGQSLLGLRVSARSARLGESRALRGIEFMPRIGRHHE